MTSRGTEGRQTVVISGAARGLGRALLRQCAARGDRVIALCRRPEALAGEPGMVEAVWLDLADETAILGLADRLGGTPIDLLVQNAAIRGATGGLAEVSGADLAAVMAVNVLGPLLLTRVLRPNLMAGCGRTVAMISSRAGSMAEGLDPDGDYAYRCSKAALNMATRKLAYDDPALTFLLLHPGWVQTEMGGPDAEVPVEVSARGILERIALATSADSGTFRTWDGRPVAW